MLSVALLRLSLSVAKNLKEHTLSIDSSCLLINIVTLVTVLINKYDADILSALRPCSNYLQG